MAALTGDKSARRYGESQFSGLQGYGVKTNVKILKGALVVKDSSGYATNASTATGLITLGVAREKVDNTGGASGALPVCVDVGEFEFENSAAGDAIALTEIGSDCYIVDNQTVAKTDGTGTRSRAGKIINVVGGKVVVRVGVGV